MHRFSRWAFVVSVVVVPALRAQEPPRVLTLDQALAEARQSNPGLAASRLTVDQAQRRSRVMFSNFLPRVSTQGAYLGSDNTRGILVPAGALGTIPGLGSFPLASTSIPQGGPDIGFALTTLQQPLTQYFKIREGVGVTRGELDASRAQFRRAEQAVSLGVIKAYAGLLIAAKRRDLAQARVSAAGENATAKTAAVQAGTAIDVVSAEARLHALQARQDLLAAENDYADLSYTLADVIGLGGNTALSVTDPGPVTEPLDSMDVYVASALRSNPDVVEAEALFSQASFGVGAAKASYIPDVGLFGGHFYQSSFPFFPHKTFVFGAVGSITLLDFGARSNTLAERTAQRDAAEHNLAMVRGRVRGEVEAAYRKVSRTAEMADVAREALALRAEALRLRVVQAGAGYGIRADESNAQADRIEADLDVLRAAMAYRIARAELDQTAGRLAP